MCIGQKQFGKANRYWYWKHNEKGAVTKRKKIWNIHPKEKKEEEIRNWKHNSFEKKRWVII